jgi:hypothetical protein
MRKSYRCVWWKYLIILGSACLAFAAMASSFSGTWRLNLEKSQLTGQTFNIDKLETGKYHFDSQGYAYDFDLNGKEYPTPDGGTVSWRAVNATTWEGADRMHGKTTVTFHLSLIGDSIDGTAKLFKPDGSVTVQRTKLTRVSGGPGFLGKWKSTEVKGAPTSLQILTEGEHGITLKFPEGQAVCQGNFDGKDHVLSEAGVPSKQTLAFEKTSSNAFKVTTKIDGKPYYVDVYTLSADGKTLTDEGNPVSMNEPVKAVYERQ